METPFAESQLFWLIVTGCAIMCLLAISLLLVFNVNQRRLLRKEATLQRIRLQHKEELLQHNIRTQEEERRRIAKDLHDEIGSKLYIIRLNISQVATEDQSRAGKLISEAKALIDRAIDATRDISHGLLPPVLEEFGLVETLRELVTDVNHSGALHIRFETSGATDTRIGAPYDLALFRIAQELVSNAIKHAEAGEASLRLDILENGGLILAFEDNGKGFDMESAAVVKGIGLNNIQSRAQMIGADIDITSAPGSGTRVQLNLRIPNPIPA